MADFTDNFSQYAVSKLPTFRDNFTVHGTQAEADSSWVSTDTSRIRVNIADDDLDFNFNLSSSNISIGHDLGVGNVSNERWVLHAKVNFTTLTQDTNTRMYVGLSNSDQTVAINDLTDADRIMMKLDFGFFGSPIKDFASIDTDGTGEVGADETIVFTFLTGVDYYLTIQRDSLQSYHVEVFTDKARTISLGRADGVCTPTTQDLRYIIIQNIDATFTTTMTGTIDEIEFWGGEVIPTIQDDFTTDKGWTLTGAGVAITGGLLDYPYQGDGTTQGASFDLGVGSISDTSWIMRFKLVITDLTGAPASDSISVAYGIADIQTESSNTNVDGLHFGINRSSATGDKFFIFNTNSALPIDGSATNSTAFTTTPVVGTFYVELKRESSILARASIYRDAQFTSLIETNTVTTSGAVTALRFINHTGRVLNRAGIIETEIDDIQIFNEVSDLTGVSISDGAQQGDQTFQEDFTLRTADFEDSFTSYTTQPQADTSWVPLDATQIVVNITNDEIDWNERQDGAGQDDTISHDLIGIDGVTPDPNTWTLRFKVDITTLLASSGDNHFLFFGLSDSSVGTDTNQDAIGVMFSAGSGILDWKLKGADAINLGGAGPTVATFSTGLATGIIYWEVKRTSATTVEASMYSDANYTILVERQAGTITSIAGLQYIKIANQQLNSASADAQPQVVGTFDDVEFYNGVSVLTDWIQTGTLNQVSRGVLDFDFDRDSTNHKITYDLERVLGSGVDASNDNWTLRWKMIHENITANVGGSTLGYVGLISTDNTVAANGTNDFIGLEFILSSTANIFRLIDTDGLAISSGIVRYTFNDLIAENTPQFFEVKRLSTTTMICNVYSDADYTQLIESSGSVTCSASVIDLQFITVVTDNQGTSVSVENGIIDNIEFYNAVSVAKTPIKSADEDFEDSFVEDNWVDAHASSGVNTSTQVIDFTYSTDSQNESISFDLETILADVVNPNRWTLRFKMNFATLTPTGNTTMWVGVSNSASSVSSASAHDALWIKSVHATGTKAWHIDISDGTIPNSNTSSEIDPEDVATGIDYYCELKRISSTLAIASVYNDRDYTQLRFTKTFTIPATITGLRYIKVMNANLTLIGNMTGIIDDVKFWNGNDATVHRTKWVEVNE